MSVMDCYYLMALGLIALEVDDYGRANALGAECLAVARRIGHARGATNALHILGRAAVGRGDRAAGRNLLEQSLAEYREYADLDVMQRSLRALGHPAWALRQPHVK
jgi:hypothetical protein